MFLVLNHHGDIMTLHLELLQISEMNIHTVLCGGLLADFFNNFHGLMIEFRKVILLRKNFKLCGL